ncbi:MAG: hypothetical protein QHI38_00015 [Armatimonadota bacterium]|nr:hypothetical protein [Armatimonadota bacterium]
MNAQKLLELYLSSSGSEQKTYEDQLSRIVKQLVSKAVSRYPTADLDDFEEECIAAVWCKIAALASRETDTSTIGNLDAFVRQAVHNRYCDCIRRKRPKWYNIKLELMETLSGKTGVSGFAMWQCPKTGVRMCGYAQWKHLANPATAKCLSLIDNQEKFKRQFLNNRDPQELPLYELTAAILDFCGGPVELDTLTGCIAEMLQAKNENLLSIDAVPDPDSDLSAPVDWLISPEVGVEDQVINVAWFRQVLGWFWKEFLELSVKQRKAIILGMSSEQVMALVSVVGFTELAEALEMVPERLAGLVSELPLPDSTIADELGVPAKAVPSVRFKAWGRIRRRTEKAGLSLDE